MSEDSTAPDVKYVIRDTRGTVGNCALWWREQGRGYTTDFDDAGVFSAEEARSIHRGRRSDVPYKYDDVAKLAKRTVDSQSLVRFTDGTVAKAEGQ